MGANDNRRKRPPAVSYEYTDDGKSVKFTIHNFARGALDQWIRANSTVMRRWPQSREYRAMIVVPHPSMMLKLYLEKRATDVTLTFSGLKGREAVVIPESSPVNANLRRTLEALMRQQPKIIRRIFSEQDAALKWLRENLDKSEPEEGKAKIPRVLIAEDNLELLRLLTKALGKRGYEIDQATNLVQAEVQLNVNRYDIALIDIQLHTENSIWLLKKRTAPLQKAGTHVVAMSADPKYRKMTTEAGVQHFIDKPVNTRELAALFEKLITSGGPAMKPA